MDNCYPVPNIGCCMARDMPRHIGGDTWWSFRSLLQDTNASHKSTQEILNYVCGDTETDGKKQTGTEEQRELREPDGGPLISFLCAFRDSTNSDVHITAVWDGPNLQQAVNAQINR